MTYILKTEPTSLNINTENLMLSQFLFTGIQYVKSIHAVFLKSFILLTIIYMEIKNNSLCVAVEHHYMQLFSVKMIIISYQSECSALTAHLKIIY